MRRRDLLIGLGTSLALVACQRREEQPKAVPPGVAILQPNTTGALPRNIPVYLPVYPGGQVHSSVDAGARGGTVSFTATASAAEIADFYASRARQAGLHPTTDVTANDVRIIMFDDAPVGHRNFVLNLTTTPTGVQVGVSYGPQA